MGGREKQKLFFAMMSADGILGRTARFRDLFIPVFESALYPPELLTVKQLVIIVLVCHFYKKRNTSM